jgi:lipopolysaccharide transport system ATP-binding protein
MKNLVIEAENLSKKYNIIHLEGGFITLRDKIGATLSHPIAFFKSLKNNKHENFWALKDANFAVEAGEIVGIIGGNGAGKSTLLKILSRITPPSTGKVRIVGRVASMLEVGTGFHPELTGRENIFLNGAILGMPKTEIIKKFDAIVAFAEITKFLDTPVKRYSSGMYVRLAFAVAAHMDADILFLDEVLAVGDAEFQQKCLAKMEEMIRNKNKTILFVSHNLPTIKSLCPRSILMENGRMIADGPTALVIDKYLENQLSQGQTNT